jgi:phosphoglycolate phosphatase
LPAKHIIFDFDGTLIDSSPAILKTLELVLRAHGVAPIRPLARDLIGPPLLATLQSCSGVTDAQLLEHMADAFRSSYDTDGIRSTEVYAGISAVLRQLLAEGRGLHLATNKRQRPTLLLLEHFGWQAWFESVYCIDSRTPPYPTKGDMLVMQLKEQKLDAGDTIYAGDTAHDEKAAADAGLRFLAVGWGYGVGEQSVSAKARVVHSAPDLLDTIKHFDE